MHTQSQYSGPTTTANSSKEGRMKVDAGGMKKKIMKKCVGKHTGKGGPASIGETISRGWNKIKGFMGGLDKSNKVEKVAPPGAAYNWNKDTGKWNANIEQNPEFQKQKLQRMKDLSAPKKILKNEPLKKIVKKVANTK